MVLQPATVEQRADNLHDLERALIARSARQRRAGEVAGDDVHVESAAGHAIDRRELARELWWPHLSGAHREEEPNAGGHRDDAGRERDCVDAERIARGEKDAVEPVSFGAQHEVAAVLPRGTQARIGHTEELVVVVAQGREPRDFEGHVGYGTGRCRCVSG